MTASFHLYNREIKCDFKVYDTCKILPFCPVKLDRTLTYHLHLESTVQKKLSSHDSLLRQLAGSEWNASADTLRSATLSLLYSPAEFCAPAVYLSHRLCSALRSTHSYRVPASHSNGILFCSLRHWHTVRGTQGHRPLSGGNILSVKFFTLNIRSLPPPSVESAYGVLAKVLGTKKVKTFFEINVNLRNFHR